MRIFITGASGFIGSAVTDELLAHGHEVVGLARSDRAAAALEASGVTVHHGSLDDPGSLAAGADNADGVVHLAFKHDFSDHAGAGRTERAVVQRMLDTLAGSDRPFLFASGLGFAVEGRPITEDDASPHHGPDSMRGGSENLALTYAEKSVRVIPARFAPTVHGEGDHGFISIVAQAARRGGASVYPGDGTNRWPAVHRSDAARLVRLGLENAPAGTILHAAAEEGVPVRQIAEALASRLGVPARSAPAAQVAEQIPFIGQFLGADIPAASPITRDLLGWKPTGPTLLDDIAAGHYDQP